MTQKKMPRKLYRALRRSRLLRARRLRELRAPDVLVKGEQVLLAKLRFQYYGTGQQRYERWAGFVFDDNEDAGRVLQ